LNFMRQKILNAVGEFLGLALLVMLAPASVLVDVRVLGDSVDEVSLTEMTQVALLLFAVLAFGYRAWRNPETRGFALLVAGFFLCMLIRELDGVLDRIAHGFWLWPALLVAVSVVAYVGTACRTTVFRPMANFIGKKSYYHIIVGLLVVLVFSRVFGSGRYWMQLLEMDLGRLFKASLQEGLELFGYLLLAYGAIWYLVRDGARLVEPGEED
jgi:hypothetical protein